MTSGAESAGRCISGDLDEGGEAVEFKLMSEDGTNYSNLIR